MRRGFATFFAAIWLTGLTALYGHSQESPQAAVPVHPPAQSIEERILFFPTKHPHGDWNPAGLQFRDVFFAAADGTPLHGWYCPVENPRAVILAAHFPHLSWLVRRDQLNSAAKIALLRVPLLQSPSTARFAVVALFTDSGDSNLSIVAGACQRSRPGLPA